MRKEGCVFAVLFLISVFAVAGVLADETANVQKAYTCVENLINTTKPCSVLSTEEKIFSLLSVGKCKDALIQDMKIGRSPSSCWPENKGGSVCDIEMTSKVVLALDSVGANTTASQEWLLAQKGVSTDLDWFLEIDSEDAITCQITYETNPDSSLSLTDYVINIGSDKKIDKDAGSCLTRANNNYWFSISPGCYDREFQISCDAQNSGDDGDFISTVLYREKNSPTFHVLDYVQSSAGGITTESVTSYCFISAGKCDYLGSLWASFVLDTVGQSVSDFLPYLETLSSNNKNFFPEPFLYILTNNLEFKTELLNRIIFHKYWEISRGKYYDSALALLPFQGDNSLTEKQNAKNWLFGIQQPNGCWDNNNIVSNGFLLYSLWPRDNHPLPPEFHSCFDSDGGQIWNVSGSVTVNNIVNGTDFCTNRTLTEYFCKADNRSSSIDVLCTDGCLEGACLTNNIGNITCAQAGFDCISAGTFCNGTIESSYVCSGADICCNPAPPDDDEITCSELGDTCVPEGTCSGTLNTEGTCSSGQVCCDTTPSNNNETECELAGYTCTFSSACTGSFVPGYDDCPGIQKCCDIATEKITCSRLNGIICSDNQFCSGGNSISTDDLFHDQTCCLTPGTCETRTVGATCEDNLGICSSSCAEGYSPDSAYTCSNPAYFCCMESDDNPSANGSYWWIWVLFALVIIVVVGILYRDKIKEFIQKSKARRSGGGGIFPGRGPGFPPRFPPSYDRNPRIGAPIQRKIIPQERPPERRPIPKPKSPKELDEVLKKLKEIGK